MTQNFTCIKNERTTKKIKNEYTGVWDERSVAIVTLRSIYNPGDEITRTFQNESEAQGFTVGVVYKFAMERA